MKRLIVIFLSLFFVSVSAEKEAPSLPTPLEKLLLAESFPGQLDRINEEGVKEPTTLGRALGCAVQQLLADDEKLLEEGVVKNCSLLDAVATEVSKNMRLRLGAAVFARESVVLKSRNSIAKNQQLLASLNGEVREALRKHLVAAAESEEGFLDLLAQKKIKNPTNFELSTYIELAVGEILPAALMYLRVADNADPSEKRVGINRFNIWLTATTASYLCRLSRPLFNRLNKYGKKVLLPALRKNPELATAVMHGTTLLNASAPILNFYINDRFNGEIINEELIKAGYMKRKEGALALGEDPYISLTDSADFYRSAYMKFYLLQLWQVFSTYKWIIEPEYSRMMQLKKMHNRLVDVAHFVRASQEAYKLFVASGCVQHLPAKKRQILENFFGEQRVGPCSDLAALCDTSTFDTRKGFPFIWGRIGRLIDIVKKNKKELRELASAIGYLDYAVALAGLVDEKQDTQNVAWSYASFDDSEKPVLHVNQVWYPGIEHAKAVATNAHLDETGAQDILITGVNGSGKSIVMSALMLTAVLGQTHGIIPAHDSRVSYFDNLFFHGNLSDEKGNGLSKGINEMKNAIGIIKSVKEHPGKTLVMFDELFSSTDSRSAELLASLVIKALVAHPHVMLVATTHNPGLSALVTGAQSRIENAVVSTEVTAEGEVIYKRQLVVPAVNKDKPALFIMRDKLKEAGAYDESVESLLNEAISIQSA